MKIIVGLGNPGEDYVNTRHNAGFVVLDNLAGDKSWNKSKGAQLSYLWTIAGKEKIELVKPNTFMNKSGDAVRYVIKKHPELAANDVVVVHDDLDIVLGEYKINFGKGPRGHKGVISVEESLGTMDFWRVRIGVESRDPVSRIPGEKYVLMKLQKSEQEVMRSVAREAAKDIVARLEKGMFAILG